jgi:L-lactate dehydrogenase complex protein LldE
MPDVSEAMLIDKMNDVEETRAEVITAVDNSCLMHIFGGLHRQRAGVRMAHIAEILASTEGEVPA